MVYSLIGFIMLGVTICPGCCRPETYTILDLQDPITALFCESQNDAGDIGSGEATGNEENQDGFDAEEPKTEETQAVPDREESDQTIRSEETEIEDSPDQSSLPLSEETNEGSEESFQEQDSVTTEDSEADSEESTHVHGWIPIIEIIHHEAIYQMEPVFEERQVLDEEAWDEEVSTGGSIYSCLQCFFESEDYQTMLEHCISEDHNYWCRPLTETIHHEAVYHTELVQVGENEVLVKEAWDEEIINGYYCPECGEIK